MQRPVDFFVVGAMKCGTGSLRAVLRQHPQVGMPAGELRFFNNRTRFRKGLEWYLPHFAEYQTAPLIGEKSPSYGPSYVAPERIKEYNPNAKMLWILRAPVARAVSHYRHSQRRQEGAALPIDHEIESKRYLGREDYPSSYIFRSRYDAHIQRFLEFFPAENMLILVLEEVGREPRKWLGEVYKFLGIEDDASIEWPHSNPTKAGIVEKFPVDAATRQQLATVLEPTVSWMERYLGRPLPDWQTPALVSA
jgi:hypothetical protein